MIRGGDLRARIDALNLLDETRLVTIGVLTKERDEARANAARLREAIVALRNASAEGWAWLNRVPLVPQSKSAHAQIARLVQDIDVALAVEDPDHHPENRR